MQHTSIQWMLFFAHLLLFRLLDILPPPASPQHQLGGDAVLDMLCKLAVGRLLLPLLPLPRLMSVLSGFLCLPYLAWLQSHPVSANAAALYARGCGLDLHSLEDAAGNVELKAVGIYQIVLRYNAFQDVAHS